MIVKSRATQFAIDSPVGCIVGHDLEIMPVGVSGDADQAGDVVSE